MQSLSPPSLRLNTAEVPAPPALLPSVSIVIPTGNRQAALSRSVPAALANPAAAQVIVVVNGSRDGSVAALEPLERTNARLVVIVTKSAGENVARQRGAEAATSEVVLFLDDDVVATPDLAAGHARHHRDGHGRVVLGYMPVGPDQLRNDAEARLYGADYEHLCSQFEQDSTRVLIDLWGGNVSLRRADALAVGFESGFALGQHTDTEFGIRCHRHGLVGIFDRTLRAEHHYVRTRAEFLDKAREQALARMVIHRLHADVMPPWLPEYYLSGIPRPLRWALHAGSGNRFGNLELHTFEWIQRASHVLGRRRVEDRALFLARAVVQLDSWQRSQPSPPPE